MQIKILFAAICRWVLTTCSRELNTGDSNLNHFRSSGYFLLVVRCELWVSTRGPPGCIMRPAATFVNYFHTIKITQFRWFGIPLTVIFPRAARQPAHNNRCGLLPRKGWTPMFVNKVVFLWHVCTISVKRRSDHSVCKRNVKSLF